jgi:ABC-type branched-subunit amino acid transport system substrate-binding protein
MLSSRPRRPVRRTARTRVAAALCAGLAATACGSTVRTQGVSAAGGLQPGQGGLGTAVGDSGLAAPGQPGVTDGSGSALAGGAAPGSVASGSLGAAPGTGADGGARPSTGTLAPGTSGRGYTATEIRLGYTLSDDGASVAAGFGVDSAYLNSGRIDQQVEAIAAYINRHGGILGRKLVPVLEKVSTQAALRDADAEAQRLCTAWTQDHKVFAAMNALGLNNPTLRACMAKADTPLLEASGRTYGAPEFARYASYLYTPGSMTTDLLMKLWVSSLVGQGYVNGWDTTLGQPGKLKAKIGLLMVDRPDTRYMVAKLKEELAKHGLKVESEVTYAPTSDGLASGQSSAVLKFKADGVTHVFGAYVFFMQQADSQKYYPRYAIDPGGGAASVTVASGNQLRGAMSAGWLPSVDVDPADYPGDPSAATVVCKKIMKAAGQDYETAGGAFLTMLGECDNMLMLAAALTAAGSISTAALRTGMESLGTMPSAQTWASRFGPDQHASALVVRDQAYIDACTCFRYTSRTNRDR